MKIQVRNLVKTYGATTAVNDVRITAEQGDLTTILGPSGCGKTTTLRTIAGLERPDQGEVIIGEDVVSSPSSGIWLPPQKRNIGFVFQSFNIWPHLNVYKNISYPLEIKGLPSDEIAERVDETMKLADIEELKNEDAGNLSGGQQARVSICRALVKEPRTLLCDEPLTGLDRNLREEMRHEIRRIQTETGTTTVYVTHNQPEAMSISDKIVLMNSDGEVEQTGPPETIYKNPTSTYAFDFIGESEIFRGTISNGSAVETPLGPIRYETGHHSGSVDVGFRPESLEIRTSDRYDDKPNTWRGTLLAKYFLGDGYGFDIEIGDNIITSKISIEEYDALDRPAEGQELSVHLPPKNVFLFE